MSFQKAALIIFILMCVLFYVLQRIKINSAISTLQRESYIYIQEHKGQMLCNLHKNERNENLEVQFFLLILQQTICHATQMYLLIRLFLMILHSRITDHFHWTKLNLQTFTTLNTNLLPNERTTAELPELVFKIRIDVHFDQNIKVCI